MASPTLLDFESLIQPIPGDNPAGTAVPFMVDNELREARKRSTRDDWNQIVELAQKALAETSKDPLLAARLTEALVRLHGFAGLRDGLRLLRELVEQCWERLYPPVEDGDLDIRAKPFIFLDDPEGGARFPDTLRTTPLVQGDNGDGYGLLTWRQVQEGKGEVTREMLEAAILATSYDQLATLGEDIDQSLEELSKLTQALNEKMGADQAPGMVSLRQAVEECQKLQRQLLQRKTPAGESPDGPPELSPPSPGTAARGAIGSRAEAYRQIAQAAARLREMEPHSPVPYLVERAVELGKLPFPDMIKALIRDANVLAELTRELGLKPPEEISRE